MITVVDSRLHEDIKGYALRYSCEDCIHFEEQQASCSLGFDSEPHRARAIELGDTVVFCKTFELL